MELTSLQLAAYIRRLADADAPDALYALAGEIRATGADREASVPLLLLLRELRRLARESCTRQQDPIPTLEGYTLLETSIPHDVFQVRALANSINLYQSE